jgi:acyl dehydratase
MTAPRYDDIAVGDVIPVFERTTTIMNWNRYAAVNDEFVFMHMDDDYGRAVGEPGAFGMGNLRTAYIMNMVRRWAGDEAQIRSCDIRFAKVNQKNDHLVAHGTVTDKRIGDDGAKLVDIAAGVTNQLGEETSPATVTVELFV